MSLSFQTIVNSVKKHSQNNPNEVQLYQLRKIYDEFGDKINRVAIVFAKQIDIGLEDLYDRYLEATIKLKPKDSGSYDAHIIRYGEEYGKELYEQTKIKKSHSLKGYIMRLGEVEGTKKYKDYWENTNFTVGIRSYVNRFGEEEGKKLHEELRKKIAFGATLAGYIERLGEEEGTIRFRDVNGRKSISQSKEVMVNRMLDEGVSCDDILGEIERRWSRSLKTCIKKYGKERGIEAYETFCRNIQKNNPVSLEYYKTRGISEEDIFDLRSVEIQKRNGGNNSVSKESIFHLEDIVLSIQDLTEDVCLYKEEELCIHLTREEYDISGSYLFRYDFTFQKLKLIIEYHGVIYHDDVDYDSTVNLNAEDIKENYNRDLYKKWIAENRGYDVMIIRSWEIPEDKMKLYNYLISRGINVCQAKFF